MPKLFHIFAILCFLYLNVINFFQGWLEAQLDQFCEIDTEILNDISLLGQLVEHWIVPSGQLYI